MAKEFLGSTRPTSVENDEHLEVNGVGVKRVLSSGFDGTDLQDLTTDVDGHLQVDVLTGGGGGTLVKDNEAVDANDTGMLVLGTDGSNYQILKTGADGSVQIGDNAGAITVDGTVAITDLNTLATSAKQLADGHNVTVDNSTGAAAVNIQDGGNTITIDGSVTADLGANNDVTVTNSTAANLKCEEASAADIKTAVQLIDDAIYADDTATHATGTSKGIGIMAAATPTDTAISANDIGMVAMALDRRLLVDANLDSGAVASGAIASGAVASGAIATGAIVDGADVTFGAKADARNTATDSTAITGMQVLKEISYMEQNPASRAVTNAGTFVTQINGDALTALQLVDNVAVAVDGNYLNVNMNIAGTDVGIGAAAVPIADGGNTITVDGTVAVTNADITSSKTALEIIDDWDDSNYANVNINVAGTDVAANAGAANAQTLRTIAATDSKEVTALELLDNSVDGNYLNVNLNAAGTDITAGAGAVTAATPRITHASDDPVTTALQIMDDWDSGDTCKVSIPAHATRVQGKVDNADTTTAREVLAAIASNYVYITSFIISVAAAGNYWLEDGDAAQITPKFYLAANGGVSWTAADHTPYKTTTVNKAVNVKGSAAGAVGVMLTGYSATS